MGLTLEDFCPEPGELPPEPAPERSYEEGYDAGLAAARAAYGTDKQLALERAVEALSDLSIGYEEARQAVLASLRPLFAEVTRVLMPDMARVGLTQSIISRLKDAAEADSGSEVALIVAPDLAELLSDPLGAHGLAGLTLHTDPGLATGQAILRAGKGETILDSDALSSEINNMIDTIIEPSERQANYG